jgi:hypothetical protein
MIPCVPGWNGAGFLQGVVTFGKGNVTGCSISASGITAHDNVGGKGQWLWLHSILFGWKTLALFAVAPCRWGPTGDCVLPVSVCAQGNGEAASIKPSFPGTTLRLGSIPT